MPACYMTCDGAPWSGTLKGQHLPIKTPGENKKQEQVWQRKVKERF